MPQTHRMLLATMIFAVATMANPIGIIFSVYIFFFMGNKILTNAHNFCSVFKYLLFSAWCLSILLVPYFLTAMWKPYEMHCLPKLNRSNMMPHWCFDTWPNAYSSAVTHLGLTSDSEETLTFQNRIVVSLAAFLIFIIYQTVSMNPSAFFSFGIISNKEPINERISSIFES